MNTGTKHKSVKQNISSINPKDVILRVISYSQNTRSTIKDFQEQLNELELVLSNIDNNIFDEALSSISFALKSVLNDRKKILLDFLLKLADQKDFVQEVVLKIIRSGNKNIFPDILQSLLERVKDGNIIFDEDLLIEIANETVSGNAAFDKTESLLVISDMLQFLKIRDKEFHLDPLIYLFTSHNVFPVKYLAAKILDTVNRPVSIETARKIIGKDEIEVLGKYLTYTCAHHIDLLTIISSGDIRHFTEMIKEAENICGTDLLKSVLGTLGWDRVNYGVFCEEKVFAQIENSLPFWLSYPEAKFLEESLSAVITEKFIVIETQGGNSSNKQADKSSSPVSLFRSYNLTHADVLRDILDIAPLNEAKINRIIEKMNKIVENYVTLFSEFSNECEMLPDKYESIIKAIRKELDESKNAVKLSVSLTRLVQMFEDPDKLENVTTLHGLKRYLHQKGLKLGFKLVDKSQTPNRTLDIIIAQNGKLKSVSKNIKYADFEPEAGIESVRVPYPVKIVQKAFLRQMFYGQETFPIVNIFLYGNEIHYYAYFRNHPVFIRIDFSPPLQGGMIDLEYFGVSNYEINSHPNIDLDSVKTFFAELEFDIQLEGTRIHARYDKERTVDFGMLCEKAEILFCLLPYMMDLDWFIESLQLAKQAKEKTLYAWIETFKNWGTLPLKLILSEDRKKIIERIDDHYDGKKEIYWNGEGEYKDIFSAELNVSFRPVIYSYFDDLGIEIPSEEKSESNGIGQITLEKQFLNKLGNGLSCGEILVKENYFISAPPELFERIHETELFARIICEDPEQLKKSILIAKLISVFERTMEFTTTGFIEGCEVQSARLPLLGEKLNVFVLRDIRGIIRMGIVSNGNGLYRYRKFISDVWKFNGNFEMLDLAALLRKNNYVLPFNEPDEDDLELEYIHLTESFFESTAGKNIEQFPENITVHGLKASPGKAVGKALLGIENRSPSDFNEAVMFAENITPEDNTYIYHALGIVSTGGGVLSHAGLIAIQFNKPAIIIRGNWKTNPGGSKSILYKTLEYKEEKLFVKSLQITLRKEIREKENYLNDGDIVILDGTKGTLTVIGSESAQNLFESIRKYSSALCRIAETKNPGELLNIRGKVLRYRHSLEKDLLKINNAVIIRYVIYEILLGDSMNQPHIPTSEKSSLIQLLINHTSSGSEAQKYIGEILQDLSLKLEIEKKDILSQINSSKSLYHLVLQRLYYFKNVRFIKILNNIIPAKSISDLSDLESSIKMIDELMISKLSKIKSRMMRTIKDNINDENRVLLQRHNINQVKRIELLLNESDNSFNIIKQLFAEKEAASLKLNENEYIITPGCGGIELSPLIGKKAANLAETSRLFGWKITPNWFVVSNKAFVQVLKLPVSPSLLSIPEIPGDTRNLKEAIDSVVQNKRLNYSEKSKIIKRLWDSVLISPEIVLLIADAYQHLLDEIQKEQPEIDEPFMAIRSSSSEEDTETAARAGEFETFLYIKGASKIVEYMKKTWCGLWTERALHNRDVLNAGTDYFGGGVIVQQIVNSRISGVLQTINVAKNDYNEILINAGLGLGQGIVSGLVAADQITVQKNDGIEEGNLEFTYVTGDKKEQVVFDSEKGSGTKITSTLYHQRFRAAMEYVEICELVKTAVELEQAYGYPLDIEFAFEGTKLWILQVRPVTVFLNALNETIENHPIVIKTERTAQ